MTDIRKLNSKKDQQFLFEIRLDWLELKRGILSSTDVRDTLRVAIPKTFGGVGEEWSPEHLFLGAVSSCFMTTFLAMAEKMGIEITHYDCHAIGQIEMMEGKYRFTKVDLYPKVYIANEAFREKLVTALEKAQKYCLISNSINSPVIYHTEILHDSHPLHRSIQSISSY
jgi:peroxiredoxin-like protein